MHICNAPFCPNERNHNHAWCPVHRWEREKYKVKPYKELLPYWCLKRCDIHGYLKHYQVYVNPANKMKTCIKCRKKVPYCPIKQKHYNEKYSSKRKDWRLKKRYGVSLDEYQNLLIAQNYQCAICKISSTKTKTLHLDHCHTSKKPRGLLCYKCNVAIGYFQDSIINIEAALNYLRLYNEA